MWHVMNGILRRTLFDKFRVRNECQHVFAIRFVKPQPWHVLWVQNMCRRGQPTNATECPRSSRTCYPTTTLGVVFFTENFRRILASNPCPTVLDRSGDDELSSEERQIR